MYLQSIKVRPKVKDIEFSYPKRISKDKVEFMTMKIEGHNPSDYYVSDSEGRISLRKAKFHSKGREFIIKPIAQLIEGRNDYFFYIKVDEIVNGKEVLASMIECDLTNEDKVKIHNVFVKSSLEKKQRVEEIDKLEVYFWHDKYKENNELLFKNTSLRAPVESHDNNEKECWHMETYLDNKSLETALEYAIFKRYGLKDIFQLTTIEDVIKNSTYTIDSKMILDKMNKLDSNICSFTLDSILIRK